MGLFRLTNLELAYPSLFEYLTKGCGFSRSGAQRRIDAARLITSVPEVAAKVKNGEISLSQLSYLQKSIRQKNKIQKVSAEQKKEIVHRICHKSMAESQKIIAQVLDLKPVAHSNETHQKDESVRLELTFTKDQWEKLIRARELLSTTSASDSWMEMFSYLAEKVIQKKTGQSFSTTAGVRARQDSSRKNIPVSTKRNIFSHVGPTAVMTKLIYDCFARTTINISIESRQDCSHTSAAVAQSTPPNATLKYSKAMCPDGELHHERILN